VSRVFQAEDGIRRFHVTGVQTCALPIFQELVQRLLFRPLVGFWLIRDFGFGRFPSLELFAWLELGFAFALQGSRIALRAFLDRRSEERRVGAGRSVPLVRYLEADQIDAA